MRVTFRSLRKSDDLAACAAIDPWPVSALCPSLPSQQLRKLQQHMTGLPEQRARYQAWQHAARLLLDGAEAERLTTQIELALMLDGHRRFGAAL